MTDVIFKIKDIHKSYRKHEVLKGLDLNIQKGEVFGIIGSSGSGKTTFLHTIIGFLKPDKGSVQVLVEPTHRALGEPVYKDLFKHMKVVKNIYGFASQLPSFYDNLTVRENLEYFGGLYDLPKRTIKTNIEILLHLMDLEPAQNVLAKNLSGGMERRLDIACALMHDPAVLILDEPTADLDPVLRNHIYDLIDKINAKDTTVILASHHLSDIERVCDRIAVLHKGMFIAVGTPTEIKSQFSEYQHIKLKTLSEKYDHIVSALRHKCGAKIVHKSYERNGTLTIATHKPEIVMKDLLTILHKKREKVDLLQMAIPSLDDIFISIVEGGDVDE